MRKQKKWACLLGLACLLLLPNLTFVHADDRDARDRQITIMPNPAGTPGRTGVLRPGPVPAPSKVRPRYKRPTPKRGWRQGYRWNNGRRHYYRRSRR